MAPGGEPAASRAGAARAFRCGTGARWLPRALAGALLVAALLAGARLGEAPQASIARARWFVILVGAAGALWIVRQGGELRLGLRVEEEGVRFEAGRSSRLLPWGEIESITFAPPFARSRRFLPATVLVDRAGRDWRVPALLEEGERLLDDLVLRSGRHDLRVWAETLALPRRMRRARALAWIGYLAAAALVAAGLAFYLR